MELEEYEENELVLDTVYNLMQFFEQSNFTCQYAYNRRDFRTYYDKVGFKRFFERYFQNEKLTERIHRNTGHVSKIKSKVFLDSSITFLVKYFLEQYGGINGLPSLMRHKSESEPFIYLPTSSTYVSVYNEFKKHFYSENNQDKAIISYYTFRKLWQETIPYLEFQLSVSNLCKVQSISIPYSPQQVGTIYFKNLFSVSLFSIYKTKGGQNSQLNFAIGEDEFPEGNSKGANTTLNIVYYLLQKFACERKKKLYITYNNYSEQNKNNLSPFFFTIG
ncbi:3397_t:CDS:2 [Gigaspora margarita]|uniref:3397_t:CDS:1 n=1 Tax=Gigaspora margarita TaxID=4874 RepID=A0ABN7UVQ1_GIGMA|nr:3397_t:CDS:2 [Gigaspora margarita]